MPRGTVESLLRAGIQIILAERGGEAIGLLAAEDAGPDPQTLCALADAVRDPSRRLSVGQQFVVAKLLNYATLAEATSCNEHDDPVAADIRLAADRAVRAQSVEQLMGVEGAAAAAWYRSLSARLSGGFSFSRRVAPRAADPVNVLLNIAQTMLYRHAILAARAAGLPATVGILHQVRSGHAALASDLQEPFRHLMDRVVIEATSWLTPAQFRKTPAGPFPLRMEPQAARRFTESLHRVLASSVAGRGQSEPVPYHHQLVAQAQSLRRHLLDPSNPFNPFTHP